MHDQTRHVDDGSARNAPIATPGGGGGVYVEDKHAGGYDSQLTQPPPDVVGGYDSQLTRAPTDNTGGYDSQLTREGSVVCISGSVAETSLDAVVVGTPDNTSTSTA